MARMEATGKVSGELWRVHEAGKEIICFMLEGETAWFRIEYDTEVLPGRADHMAKMLSLAAEKGNGIEVLLEYDLPEGSESPLFRNVKYIQVRAAYPSVQPQPQRGQKREVRRLQSAVGFGSPFSQGG